MNYLGVHDSIRWCDTQAESPATQGDSKPFGHGPDEHAKGKWENDAKPLLTDYDDECLLSNHLTLAAHALNGAIIDLTTDENREEDDNHVIWRPKDDATEEAKQRYRMAETDLHAEISRFRSQVREIEVFY